jgi:hypothetical protein
MINGLINTFEELNGLKTIYIDELQTGVVTQDEINTLDGVTSNIQSQINSLQNVVSGLGTITISGLTVSGVIFKPYLEEYYDDKTEVTEKVGNAYNTIMDTFTNYYTKSSINSITSTISGNIDTISGNIASISGLIYNTISSNINNNSLSITSVSSYINNTISSNIYNNSLSITSVSSYIYNTISNNIYNNALNITSVSSYIYNTISNNIYTSNNHIVSISSLIYNTISSNINNNALNITSVSSYIYNTISSNIYNNALNITSVSSYIYNTISNNIYISNNNMVSISSLIYSTISNNIDSISGLIYNTISSRIKNVSDVANTADEDATYSRKQIDTQGTKIMNFFGIEVWDPPPSALNQRIIDAKKAGTDAQDTATAAASSASSNTAAITAIAIVLGFNSVGLLITAVGAGTAYTSLAATVTALGLTSSGHSFNLTTLNTKTQYMNTNYDLSNNYTVFTSDIKVSQPLTSSIANVFLSSSVDGNSFFCNTVKFYKDITIDGTIINTDISSIKNKVQYMNVDTVSLPNTSTFLSNINICDPSHPDYIPYVHLSLNETSSFFNNNVHFYKDISIDGTITNTSLTNKIQYITGISGNTLVNSSLYIQNSTDPTKYISKLANDYAQLSYIGTNLTISGNVTINGSISNNEITTISGLVNTISGNINTISGLVNTNKLNINTISGLVNTNKLNITTLSGQINTLSGQINNANNLPNAITVQGDSTTGYTINIGAANSKVYINGDLYYNNDLFLRIANSDGNQVGMDEYINQMF